MSVAVAALLLVWVPVLIGSIKFGDAWFGRFDQKRALPERPVPFVDTSCRYYEIRQTQLKMLDAGIIDDEDISTCDNPNCKACATTHRTVEYKRKRGALAARTASTYYGEVEVDSLLSDFWGRSSAEIAEEMYKESYILDGAMVMPKRLMDEYKDAVRREDGRHFNW